MCVCLWCVLFCDYLCHKCYVLFGSVVGLFIFVRFVLGCVVLFMCPLFSTLVPIIRTFVKFRCGGEVPIYIFFENFEKFRKFFYFYFGNFVSFWSILNSFGFVASLYIGKIFMLEHWSIVCFLIFHNNFISLV